MIEEMRGRWEEGRAWLVTSTGDEQIQFTCPLCAGRRMHTRAEHDQLAAAVRRLPPRRCGGIITRHA